ncbi:MAG: thioredoxin family protein [bacterium]|nr:thioredoxin family protein [bacterium]
MNGKELLQAALRCERTERAAWVPFVGCHAGALLGIGADEYLRSPDAIVRGVSIAIERYRPDGIPVTFDLQVEAEALGCELVWSKENPPAVASHPLEKSDLSALRVPGPDAGRIPLLLDATRRLVAVHPHVAFYGLITGPFTLALHLTGPNIFMLMYDQPHTVHEIMAFCRDVALAMAEYYVDAGCSVIAVVDPMTSQIGPEHFRTFVTPYVTPVFEAIRRRGALSSFFVCGHAQANIEAMCETKPDNISVDENIQLAYVRDVALARGISFGGNLQLTVVLLFGTREDCMRNAIDCLEVGGTQGYVLSPGCDIPYATPPANLETVMQIVHDPYQRAVARALATTAKPEVGLDMSDYGKLDRVVIDIITLDSEACAPCQYMVEAVKAVMPVFEDLVIWREHKIKVKDSVEFMQAMMVRNVPTICIDGEIVFVSRIPSRDELIHAIQERLNRKMRYQLKQYSARVLVLGDDGEASKATLENVRQAVRELGVLLPVEYITDPAVRRQYDVEHVPTVVTVQNTVKCTGKVPKVEIIKEWVKELRL